MYPLPTLQFISTCINLYQSYIARCLQSQDRSPIPSHLHNPTHSFIHPLVTVFQVLRGKAGCVCDLKEFTLMCTRTHMASTKHTRTHTRLHLSVFLFHGFEPLIFQGLRDMEAWVPWKPDPHTFPHGAQPSQHMANLCSPDSPHLGVLGAQVWLLSEPGSQRHLNFYPEEYSAEAKLGHTRPNCICVAD